MRLHFNASAARKFLQEILPVAGGMAGVLVAALVGRLFGSTAESAIRGCGMLLQFGGLVIAANGLRRLRKSFGLPPIFPSWWALFKQVFAGPRNIVLNGSGRAFGTFSASGRLTVSLAKGAPLHTRITILEQNLEQLQADVVSSRNTLARDIQASRDEMSARLNAHQQETTQLAQRLKESQVGDLRLEAVGLAWLLIGVVIATIAPEIACKVFASCATALP